MYIHSDNQTTSATNACNTLRVTIQVVLETFVIKHLQCHHGLRTRQHGKSEEVEEISRLTIQLLCTYSPTSNLCQNTLTQE